MKTELVTSIPLTRAWLQFHAQRLDASHIQVDYELILPLNEVDCRGTFDHKTAGKRPKSHRLVWLDKANCWHIPLGRTTVGTENAQYPFSRHPAADPSDIDLPFRDGAHSGWDNEKLGLEIYYRTADKIYRLIPAATPGWAHTPLWLVWSMEHRGFWAANEEGYTNSFNLAGRYSFAQAAAIVRNGNYGATPNSPHEAMIADGDAAEWHAALTARVAELEKLLEAFAAEDSQCDMEAFRKLKAAARATLTRPPQR